MASTCVAGEVSSTPRMTLQLAAANEGLFYGPRGLAFHDGELYVTDTGNERVQVFTPDGTFVRMFGTIGSDLGNLLEPVGIAVTMTERY